MAPTTLLKPTDLAKSGEKRVRGNDDASGRPTKTVKAVNFEDRRKVVPRKPRTKPSDDPAAAMEEIIDDESRAREEAKKKRELDEVTLQDMAATFGRARFSKNEGHIRFFRGNHPRFTPSEDMFQLLMKDKAAALVLAAHLRAEGDCVWVQAYNTQNPEDLHLRRLRNAITHIADLGLAEGFDTTSYEIRPIPKPNGRANYSPILVSCKTAAAAAMLVGLGHFAFKEANGETAFFTRSAVSFGSAIIIDIKNAPSEPTRLMAGVWKNLHPIIKWKSKEDDGWVPENFQYSKVEAPKLAKEATPSAHWRIAFTPDVDAYRNWTRPETIGINGTKGEVSLHDPPFCQACISLSHSREACPWWKVSGVTAEMKKPKDATTTKWIVKRVFGTVVRKTGTEADTQPETESGAESQSSATRETTPRPPAGGSTLQTA